MISSKPSKQRKLVYNLPNHLRYKLLTARLSEDLEKQYGIKRISIRKGDSVKLALPFWRYSHGTSHRSNISRKWKVKSGRYPKKAIKYVLKLLDNAENNANSKGLDIDNLKIVHIAAHKGLVLKRYMTRAFGRSTRKYKYLSHIEVILGEV